LDLEKSPGEDEGADDFAGATWLFAFGGTPNTGGEAAFPNRLNEGGAGGALAAFGGGVDKPGAGVAGVVEGFAPPNERRGGGVLGLGGSVLFADTLLDSSASAFSGDGGGIGKTAKRGFGDAGIWGAGATTSCGCSSSSSRETGVLARGELRAGRVLGRLRPTPNRGVGVPVEAGAGDGLFLKRGSLVGVPGGVVLSSSGIVGNTPGSGESEGEGVTWIAGSSG